MIHLNPGELVTDESKFLARNKSYSENLKGYAKKVHQEKLERYHKLKNQQNDTKDHKDRPQIKP